LCFFAVLLSPVLDGLVTCMLSFNALSFLSINTATLRANLGNAKI